MKKSICSVLIIVLVLSLFTPGSFAAKWDYEIPKEVERTNNEIDRLIELAIQEVEIVDGTGYKADKEINKISDKLVKDTGNLADKMKKEAGKVGIEVICEYIEVELGGQKVLIDPLIVISF